MRACISGSYPAALPLPLLPSAAKAITANAAQLAAGRLVGSLSVLTARGDDESGYTAAMLASWVSQASFNPPGLTVSVKKDRAMEPLLVVGGKFAVSLVSTGKDKEVMKRLARPFSPGEDRLAGGCVCGSPGGERNIACVGCAFYCYGMIRCRWHGVGIASSFGSISCVSSSYIAWRACMGSKAGRWVPRGLHATRSVHHGLAGRLLVCCTQAWRPPPRPT